MPITTEQSRPGKEDSKQVHKRVRLMAVLGILLTSFVIGGIATLMLYTSQVDTLRNQLLFSIELEAAALESELARLGSIASQVTSRTRIRQELERYNGGEIGIQALTDFTTPKLSDAMHSNNNVLGITRLSRDLTPLLSVGSEIPLHALATECLGVRDQIRDTTGRQGGRLGTDLQPLERGRRGGPGDVQRRSAEGDHAGILRPR